MPFLGRAPTIGAIDDNVVTSAKIVDDAVTSAKIADDAVTAAKIGTGEVKVFGKGRGRTKPRWNGFVRSMVRGVLAERITANEIGSGVLFNFSRADEAFVFSYEGTGNLYKIGGGEESVTTDYVGTGALAPLQSNVKVNFVPNWRGSGVVDVTGEVSSDDLKQAAFLQCHTDPSLLENAISKLPLILD